MTRLMGQLLGIAGLIASGHSSPAAAQGARAQQRTVSIQRVSLDRALRLFSRQTGRQVAFAARLVRGKIANPVAGSMAADAAIARLLSGTGLSATPVKGGYVLVQASAEIQHPNTPTNVVVLPVSDAPKADVVVIGTRLGGGASDEVKRRSLQSVSVLTEADIRNVPDTSRADVVRRIPGVQLSVRAAGGIVTIRGLSQTEDRLNGRNLASTTFRGFDIAALPSDIVAGIDVYKTPSASQLEGGIGGVIDFHTRRPFDGDGAQVSGAARAVGGTLDSRIRDNVSAFVGTRGNGDAGEVGALVGISHQVQDVGGDIFRTDTTLVGRTASDDPIDAPANATKRYLRGTKTLSTVYSSAQWRPVPTLEFTGDVLFNRSALDFTNVSLLAGLADGRAIGPFALHPRDATVVRGRWADVPLESSTSRGQGRFDVFQHALSVRHHDGPLAVLADLSRTKTGFRYGTARLTLRSQAPELAYAIEQGLPRFVLGGLSPEDPAAWRFGGFNDVRVRDDSGETAARIDVDYAVGGLIQSLKLGARFARRTVRHRQALQQADVGFYLGAVGASDLVASTGDRLFGRDYPQPSWIAPTGAALSPGRVGQVREAIGLPSGAPGLQAALSYDMEEAVASGYGEATFEAPVGRTIVQGNAGLRYAGTDLSVSSAGADMVGRGYAHWLPSLNLRAELTPRLFARAALSRQITRPSFMQLAPTVTVDFVNALGDAGNPRLQALTAWQYDAALEWYLAPAGHLYASLFYKDVAGFIRTQATFEIIQGQPILVSRPVNAADGWIAGVELGYAHRLAFLPGPLSGLGIQGSYTGIDSFLVDNGAGFRVPLEQMSRHNYAVVGTYDKGGIKAGVTWIWRSRLLQVSRGDALGRPLYRNPYGQLDANLSMDLGKGVSATIGVLNALRRRTTEYFGHGSRPNQVFEESRRVLVGITYRSGDPP